jgi:hypothetical protein
MAPLIQFNLPDSRFLSGIFHRTGMADVSERRGLLGGKRHSKQLHKFGMVDRHDSPRRSGFSGANAARIKTLTVKSKPD